MVPIRNSVFAVPRSDDADLKKPVHALFSFAEIASKLDFKMFTWKKFVEVARAG